MDFTLSVYKDLLATLKEGGFGFQTFKEFLGEPGERVVILRHDVDLLPLNSLATARIEHDMGINGSYYFREVQQSFDESIMQEIEGMGHEVGYHYECMHSAGSRLGRASEKVVIDDAYEDFKSNLKRFRKIVTVTTIAMHGSPRSRFNNLDLWKKYDYRELGIIGEPYLDLDFLDVLYLTDTGRRWDGKKVSVRDRVESGFAGPEFVFRSTHDIISAAKEGRLPSRIMINVHPQRWTDSAWPWMRELVWQNMKNVIKGLLMKSRG